MKDIPQMKSLIPSALVGIICALIGAAVVYCVEVPRTGGTGSCEYKLLTIRTNGAWSGGKGPMSELNELAAEGWRAVGYHQLGDSSVHQVLLERKK